MARDYAKRATKIKSKRKSPRRKAKRSHWKLWLFTILLLAGFIWFLHNLTQSRKTHSRVAVVNQVSKPLPVQPKQDSATPQFDFYTMLPKERVKILQPHVDEQYYLEITAVQAYTAADRLRAELSLLGFAVYITKIIKKEVVWYQVNVGPYLTKSGAEADQQQLLKNNVTSTLKQQKK